VKRYGKKSTGLKNLNLETVINGMVKFSRNYKGKLITEIMLVKGINDNIEEISKIIETISKIKPVKSYISIPTRPPAEKLVKPADEHILSYAYILFSQHSINTEYLNPEILTNIPENQILNFR